MMCLSSHILYDGNCSSPILLEEDPPPRLSWPPPAQDSTAIALKRCACLCRNPHMCHCFCCSYHVSLLSHYHCYRISDCLGADTFQPYQDCVQSANSHTQARTNPPMRMEATTNYYQLL